MKRAAGYQLDGERRRGGRPRDSDGIDGPRNDCLHEKRYTALLPSNTPKAGSATPVAPITGDCMCLSPSRRPSQCIGFCLLSAPLFAALPMLYGSESSMSDRCGTNLLLAPRNVAAFGG